MQVVQVVRTECDVCVSDHAHSQMQRIKKASANAPASSTRPTGRKPMPVEYGRRFQATRAANSTNRKAKKKRLAGALASHPNPVDSGGYNLFHRFGVESHGSGL